MLGHDPLAQHESRGFIGASIDGVWDWGALGESHARLTKLTMMTLLGAVHLPEGVAVLLPSYTLGTFG